MSYLARDIKLVDMIHDALVKHETTTLHVLFLFTLTPKTNDEGS
jgi:hypothetical protein